MDMKRALVLASAVLLSAPSASAYDKDAVVFGLGATQVFDESEIGGNIEYRGADFNVVNGLSPMAGVEFDANGAIYGYGGLLYDLKVNDYIAIVPSLAVGLYHEGDGKDLGGTFAYRSAIEVDYLASEKTRFGVRLSHKSNAGMYDHNPGTEEILALYSMGF